MGLENYRAKLIHNTAWIVLEKTLLIILGRDGWGTEGIVWNVKLVIVTYITSTCE